MPFRTIHSTVNGLHPNAKNLKDLVVGRWTVLRLAGRVNGRLMWECRCECGTVKDVLGENLSSKATLSCGCWRAEKASITSAKHGFSRVGKRAPEYGVWCAIIGRCCNSNLPSWDSYGGRGIRVCERWRNDFVAFYEDMGPRPSPKHEIERKDNDGNYDPGNCIWATDLTQASNKRNNRHLTYGGKTLTIAQWSRETCIPYFTLMYRAKHGWTAEKALTTPVRPISR